MVKCQNLPPITHQPSPINHQPSTDQPSTINHQPSTINHHPSTINYQLSTNSLLPDFLRDLLCILPGAQTREFAIVANSSGESVSPLLPGSIPARSRRACAESRSSPML